MRLGVFICILLFTLLFNRSAQALDWELFDVDRGGKPSLAITSDGTPHISYMAEESRGFVRHAVWNGTAWDIQLVSQGYFYGPLSLALDNQNRPHIIYHDHQDMQFQPDKGDQVHASWDGTRWTLQTVQHNGHDGWDNALALDGSTPKTASVDPAQFGSSDGIEYWDGQRVEQIGSGPILYEYGTGIALDADKNPHISYFDTNRGQLKHAVKRNGRWTLTTVDAQSGAGMYSSIRIGPDDQPHISYYYQETQTSGTVRYARFNGTAWTVQDVDRIDNVVSGMVGARNLTSLAFGLDSQPRISYSSMSTLKYATWTGSAWQVETAVSLPRPSTVLGGLTSHKIGPDGTVHIAFYEMPDRFTTTTGTVRYARGTLQNLAPAFVNLTDETLFENTPFSLVINTSDPEGDVTTVTASGLPEGVSFSDHTLIWTPDFTQAGTYRITFTASDGALETTQEITLTVQDVNIPIQLSAVSPNRQTILTQAGSQITLEITPQNLDNDPLTFTWTLNGQPVPDATGPILTFNATGAEEDVIMVSVSDGTDTVTQTWRTASMLKGDFNASGTVDFTDFLAFVRGFGKRTEDPDFDPDLDIDGNGAVDFPDFLIFTRFFGAGG
ncbi:MAG: putative Ig domain-containing protein [bacterium]|nr:putative Ig domain-containing protein [bacterium]